MIGRIIAAAVFLLAFALPLSGSAAISDANSTEAVEVFKPVEAQNPEALAGQTGKLEVLPGSQTPETTPAPFDQIPEDSDTPVQTPQTTPGAGDGDPAVTPVPSLMPTPTPQISPAPSKTPPTPSQTPVPPSQTPAPPSESPEPRPTPGQVSPGGQDIFADDPIVKDLPQFDVTSNDYLAYKTDVAAIIQKAEKDSGIKSVYGVFIMDPVKGYYFGVNENLTRTDTGDNSVEGFFNSASVIKLFQGYILCDMMRRGELDANKTYYDATTGRSFKLLNMITTMISRSDNNYSNAVLRLIGNVKANEVLNRLGIFNSKIYGEMSGAIGYSQQNNLDKYGTSKRCARLTPRDAGLILYNVYINRETDPYMKTMNKALLGNIYNTRIPVGVDRVDESINVAHKTGTNSALGVYNDAGIIYCSHPFILVAFTQSTSSGAGQGFIRNLAEELTRYFDAKP